MARALVVTVREPEMSGDTMTLSWRHVFYRAPVVGFDAGVGSVVVTPAMTVAQIKGAIKAAIQADATALGYGTLERAPQNLDELFDGL